MSNVSENTIISCAMSEKIDGKLNILVLHRLGDPKQSRHFLRNHVFCLKNYAPQHNYIYHDVHLKFPSYLKDVRFHGIIFDVTFLCLRWFADRYINRMWEEYSFLKDVDAVKIALPQDEYDHNRVLDEWLTKFNTDIVYTVCPEHWDILYPNYSKTGQIKLGYTGYLDDGDVYRKNLKPFQDRRIDVGYRARNLPYYFGRIGEIKSKIGGLFLKSSKGENFICDISNLPEDAILGEKWLDFIGDSKFTLGSNSGSSLLDPYGEIGKCVRNYCESYPSASFEEVESACFPGLDGQYEFTALSPRLIEAATMKSCQVLVKGSYSHVVKSWEDYIPLESDFSNKQEVFEAMRDHSYVKQLIDSCFNKIANNPALRYREHVNNLLHDIVNGVERKSLVATDDQKIRKMIDKHSNYIENESRKRWKILRRQKLLSGAIEKVSPRLHSKLLKIYRAVMN